MDIKSRSFSFFRPSLLRVTLACLSMVPGSHGGWLGLPSAVKKGVKDIDRQAQETAPAAILTAPAGLFAARLDAQTVHLSWTDLSQDEVGFPIERAPDNSGSPGAWSAVGEAPINAVAFDDSGAGQDQVWYRLRARGAAGFSDYTQPAYAPAHEAPCDSSVTAQELANFTAATDYADLYAGKAVLIMKCGEVVFERYVPPFTQDNVNMLASGTKSFSSALFALGVADGLWSEDELVAGTITEWQGDPRKSQIRIKHLLSLSGGLLDSPEYSATNVPNLDTYDLAINDSTTPYGLEEACIYAPSNFQVLAAMFERKTGGVDPVQFLYDRLFSTLGVSADRLPLWTRDINGKPQMAGGAYLTAREWANYGKLFWQNGVWNGEALLEPSLVQRSVTYVNPTFLGYGWTWWLNVPTAGTYDPAVDKIPNDATGDGDQFAATCPTDAYMAAGTGKQRLFVIPSLNLVIVRFANYIGTEWSDGQFLGLLLGTL